MAAPYYASITSAASALADVSNSGTSSTSTDIIELRMGTSTYTTSRREVLEALEVFKRWVIQGGTDQAGSNLPDPPNQTYP